VGKFFNIPGSAFPMHNADTYCFECCSYQPVSALSLGKTDRALVLHKQDYIIYQPLEPP